MAENVALANQLQAIQLGASLFDRALQRERLNREENRLAEQLALQQKRFDLERQESLLRQSALSTDAEMKSMQLADMTDFNKNDKIQIGDYLKKTAATQTLDQFDKVPLPNLTSTIGRTQFEQLYKNDRNRVIGTSVQNAYENAQAIQASAISTLSKNAPDLWIPVARLMDPSKPLFQQSQEFQELLTKNAKEYSDRQIRIKETPIRVAQIRADSLISKIKESQDLPPVLKATMQSRLKTISGDMMLTPEQKTTEILKIQDEYLKYIPNQAGASDQGELDSAINEAAKIDSGNRPSLDSFFKK